MNPARVIALAAAAVFSQGTPIWAECLTPPPPCEAMKQASVVVLAHVVDATRPGEQPNRPGERFMRHDARLRVLERFKGIAAGQTELTISIPYNMETTVLSKAETYLIYADVNTAGDWHSGKVGDWQTSCTRTKVADSDDQEVRTLRQCK